MILFTKKIFNKKIKHILFLIFLLLIYIVFSAFSYTKAVSSNISTAVFRLHVIANSDSAEDQALKYLVRDSIINYINDLTTNCSSKEEVIRIASNHLDDIKLIALQTIRESGYYYDVNVSIGNYSFPTKKYGDISLPAGFYDALKVEIGSASGQNWWCVMFPPLCFVDVTSGIVPDESKEIMQDNLSDEEYNLISKNTSEIKVKFKIVEVLQNLNISGIFM